MKHFWLFLKTRVSGYFTQQGTWVEAYYDKRPTRKEKPQRDEAGPAPADSQLNLFSLLNEPSKVAPQATAPPHDTSTVTEDAPAPKPSKKPRPKPVVDRVILDYDRPWAELEATVPEFGAKNGWSPRQRKKANSEAADLWQQLQGTTGAKNEPLTVHKQLARANRLVLHGDWPKTWRTKLAAYSGEGGIGDSLNEYYTPPKVAAAMWYLLRRFGLERGHVLEPCAGNGVFQETKPAGIAMTAVEWSPTSAGMNALLHPEDDVQAMALEHFVSADAARYDAVIGNVPFGVRGAIAGFDKPDLGKAEEYFVDTCLDKTKEGGLVCLIVPHGIATNPTARSFRKRVMSKADVVGLHRLPNTAFRHSGTAVVTDILLLRKRNQDVANALGALDDASLNAAGVWDAPWVDGAILDDPVRGHLHGTAQANWRGGYDVEGDIGPVPAAVATMPLPDVPDDTLTIEGLAKALEPNHDVIAKALRAAKKHPYPELATGTTKLINGELYILQGDPRRWHRAADVGELSYEPSSKEGQALALGQRVKQATEAVRDGLPISNLEQLRTDVKAYIATHGNPGGDKTLAALGQRDPRFLPLIASVTADNKLSDLLEGKATGMRRDESVDWSNFDEMAKVVLNDDGRTMSPAQFLESWAGEHTEDDVLRHLYASDRYAVRLDGAVWGLREDLTAGDLYPKLDAHEVALRDHLTGTPLHDQLVRQRQWLIEAIQPKTLEEFEVSLRSGFVPVACLSDYFTWVAQRQGGDGRINVTFDKGVFSFLKEEGSSRHWIWFDEWHDRYLNRDGMRKEDWERMSEKEQAFKDWLSTSQAWRGVIEEGYNRSFNSFKPKRYGDQPVEVPGWNPDMALNDYQHPALRWGIEEGKGIVAYDVGLGKAQPLDAKILTPMGWKRMGDIQVGDLVISGDGTPTEVLGVFPQGEKEIFKVTFNDGAETECCDDHLWLTRTELERNNLRRGYLSSGSYKVRALSEIRQTLVSRNIIANHSIPMVLPVEFIKQPTVIDPYMMGILLGDGGLSDGSPIVSSSDQEIINIVEHSLPSGYRLTRKPTSGSCPSFRIVRDRTIPGWHKTANLFVSELSNLGLQGCLSDKKFIPNIYKFNSRDVRLAILQGLMDTDGFVDREGVTVQFSSTSEVLAKDVQFLVQSFGGNATISSKIPSYSYNGERKFGKKYYTVHLRIPPLITPFRLSRKLSRLKPKTKYLTVRFFKKVEPVGRKPAQCIKVAHPSSLYVTDDCIVTHNTAYAIALIAKLKEQGKARRPVIVVPKSVTANWAAEAEKFRPGSKVLIIGETHSRTPDGKLVAKPDSKAERDKKWHLITQNDYDYILVTQPAFNDIDVDPLVKGEYVRQDFWVQRAKQLDKATDRRRREIEERYHQAMADKDFIKRSNAIYWNQLGVDLLIADEGHSYKNLFSARDRFGETPKFLGGSGFAKRALDMSHKAQWLRDTQHGRGVYFLTATPTKNSPLEVYSMLSHIAPEAFTSRGIRNEEDFIDRYCEIETRQVLGTDGVIADSPVVTGFKNMDELRSVMGRYIYRKTADEVGLKLPDKQVHEHFVDMTDDQETEYMALRALAKDSQNETGDAHIFSIMDKMAKAAMDLSLLDASRYPDAESPKLDAAVKNIVAKAKDGGQIVFADQVPVHQRLKDRLIKAGFKASEIGIINAQDAPDSAKRQNLANDFVNGKLKVIIGNTATMGEGVNLQKHTSDIHHLDIPWEPASIQQRNGRGLRQGNTLSTVRLHTYLAKRSFDGYRWQTMSGKKDWMDQLWHGADRVENPAAQQGVTSRDELLLMMADDPLKAREELEKNKDEQMKRYVAIQKKQASDTFRQYVKAKMTYAALHDRQEPTAHMLKMRIDRIRGDLQRHEQFPNKALLDVEGPILITAAGQAYHPGAAFLMEGGGKGPATISSEPTTWSVEAVDVGKRNVTMRPIGHAATSARDTGVTTFDLQDLESGLTPTDPISAGAELRQVIEDLQHPVALKRYPREMLEEHLPAIQDRIRALMSKPRDYTTYEEGDYKRKELWGIEEGRTTPTKIFPGSKEAATATYIVPNTELMNHLLDHAIREQDEHERRRDTYGYGRRRGRSTYNAYEHRFREALYQFFEHQERDRMMRNRKREKQEQQEALAKSQPRLRLLLKSFPDHKGRPGQKGGSQKRDRSEEVKKEFQETGRQKEDRRTYDETKRDTAKRELLERSAKKEVSTKDLPELYRRLLQKHGVSEQFRVEELRRFRQAFDQVIGKPNPKDPLSKAVATHQEGRSAYGPAVVRPRLWLRFDPRGLGQSHPARLVQRESVSL